MMKLLYVVAGLCFTLAILGTGLFIVALVIFVYAVFEGIF